MNRSDSLAAELRRKKRFDEYFSWRAAEQPSLERCLARLAEWGIKSSLSAVHRLHKSGEAFAWRVQEAATARDSLGKTLPVDMEQAIRESVLRQCFDKTLGELSHKELMDYRAMATEERKLTLKEHVEPEKLKLAERRVALLEKKLDEAKDTLTDTKLTPEQVRERMKEILA
ncbi:MAG: hypothetical protein LBK76_04545 [Verrucomicrobiales bacterium]|jgi:hypothetical protein|nr:hypothetical protein [Verrucomicrobiales bacterium]